MSAKLTDERLKEIEAALVECDPEKNCAKHEFILWALADFAQFFPAPAADLLDARNAIKLILGRSENVPWEEVPDSEVDGYIAQVKALAKEGAKEQ